MPKPKSRTIFKLNEKEVIHFATQMASNGQIPTGYPAAITYIKKCFIAKKGSETRELSDTEASVLIKRYLYKQ